MTDPNDVPRTMIDQRIIDAHAEWMREHAFGLRMLTLSQAMGSGAFANETLRQQLIEDIGSQIARDAFKRGLGIIAMTPPQYLVRRHLGLWLDPDRVIVPEREEWLPAPPPASMLEPRTTVEIMIEAFGFPIGKREV